MEISVLPCCALVQVFTRLVYGASGVSAVVTVLSRGRAGIVWKREWLRYSSAACFPENTISARYWGNSVLFRTTLAARDCGGAHCPPLWGKATSSKFPPSDVSDICYCLLLLRSLSCCSLKLLYDRFFLASCFLFTIKKSMIRYLRTSVLWNQHRQL